MRGKKKSLFFSASFTFSLPLFFTCTPKRHNTKKKHPTRVPPRWRKMQKNVLTQSLDLWTSSLLKIRSTTELCERAFAQFYFLELHKQRTLVRKERKRKPDFDSLSPSQPRFLSPLFSRLPLSPKSPCSPPPHALLARRGKQLAISYPCFSLPLSLLLSVLECRLSIASSSSSPPHSLSFYPLPLSRPPLHPTQFPPRTQVIALVAASTSAVSLLVAAPQLVGPREEIASRSSATASTSSPKHQSPPSPGFRKTSARSAIRSNASPGPGGSKAE